MYAKSTFKDTILSFHSWMTYSSEFGATFLEARERCGAATSFGTFDTNVIEIEQKDLKGFLDALCEGPEGY